MHCLEKKTELANKLFLLTLQKNNLNVAAKALLLMNSYSYMANKKFSQLVWQALINKQHQKLLSFLDQFSNFFYSEAATRAVDLFLSKEQGIKPRQKSSEWLNDNNIIDIYFYLANKQFFLAIKIVLKKSKSDLAAAITCLTLIQKASFKIDVNFSEKIKNLKQILIHQQSDYYQT